MAEATSLTPHQIHGREVTSHVKKLFGDLKTGPMESFSHPSVRAREG